MKRKEQGAALIGVLVVILMTTAFVGLALNLSANTARMTDSSRDFAALRQAAEGAVEFAYGAWLKTANTYYRQPTTAELASALVIKPTFSGLSYSSGTNGSLSITATDGYGAPVGNPVSTPVFLDSYPGWQGRKFSYLASARLDGPSVGGKSVTYGVKRSIEYATVPLFQAMAFFEGNLEIYRPATMIVSGLVHTNSRAYVSGQDATNLTFLGNVSYVTGYTHDTEPPYATSWSGYVPNSTYSPVYPNGFAEQVHAVDRMEPLGVEPATVVDPSTLNKNDDSMRELIEPPDPLYTDPAPIAQRRLYNKAGIIVKISSGVATVTTQNGTTLTSTQKTTIKNAISQQTIYDRREGAYVDVSTLDVGAVRSTLEAATSFNDVLYIYDDNLSSTDQKAIRLKNGGNLPADGLTVASQNPIYIQGDYNTGTTTSPSSVPSNNGGNSTGAESPVVSGYGKPSSAVIGDAVMILSNSWSDADSSRSLSYRQASNTTVNTAIISGFLPSGWVNGGVTYGYSGGLNNFPRFLEDWTDIDFTYTGSLVQLYQSKIFKGEWDTGVIYAPPRRCWNFDTDFLTNPPPGSVDAVSVSRGALTRF